MIVKLTYGLREDRTTKSSLLNKTVVLSELAGVVSKPILEMDSVNHAVYVKEVVAGDGFMKWIGAVGSRVRPRHLPLRTGPWLQLSVTSSIVAAQPYY